LWGDTVDAQSLSRERLFAAERVAVESRRKIESGHFIVSVSYTTFVADPSYKKARMRYEVFLKGADERVDLGYFRSGKLVSENATIFTKNTFIQAPLSGGSVIQLFGPTTRPSKTLETPDPRLLGFVP